MEQNCTIAEQAARACFPRGLAQPAGSFRFSADALLLACFPEPGAVTRFVDLGTGCGVAALALLCRYPRLAAAGEGVGVDVQPDLAEAARHNAARLGFADRLTVRVADLLQDPPPIPAGSCDLALANPPYRQLGKGRLPVSLSRQIALFGQEGTLEAFCAAAAHALREEGRFALIFPTARLEELLRVLEGGGLSPVRIRPVRTKQSAPVRLVLVEAVKGEAAALVTESPLVLFAEKGGSSRLTEEALAFCPFLSRSQASRG